MTSAPTLGDPLPALSGASQVGHVDILEHIRDSWAVIFSLPADFTPICTTELAEVARMLPEFEERDCKVVGVCVDTVASHKTWIEEISRVERVAISFPVIADADGAVCSALGWLHPHAKGTDRGRLSIRGTMIVDPQGVIQVSMMYPTSTGRNFSEVVRVLDALRVTSKFEVGTPANWQANGEVVILPSVGEAEATKLFPKGFYALTPYLRLTEIPDEPEA